MNCSYHPDLKATAQCSVCRKLLCDDCADHLPGNIILCSHCQVMSAINDCVKSDIERLKEKQEKEPQEKETVNKDQRRKWVIIGIIALVVLIGNVLIYYFTPVPRFKTFVTLNHPMTAAVVIDAAIKNYARDHAGRVPETLDQLYGKYIPRKVLSPVVLKRFVYNKASDTTYELIIRTADNQLMPDIQFTKGDVAPLPTQ